MRLLGQFGPRAQLSRLRKLLGTQRQELRQGRLAALASGTQQLEALLDQIVELESKRSYRNDPAFTEALAECRIAAQSNLALLEASRAGLAAARKQLQDIETAGSQLSTYTGSGLKKNIIRTEPQVEKRS
ncbi:hypothetical protein [Algicella marina]|uniref:Flagellar protein FlgN n=1 Tax=Algicella marina TaxID=2683284 RepID=A0A6P1T585_9RHOB|nr:hypothetical protein [Algicella marina]QHQ36439.1 hypothetical protein GO499_15275 [Algicella marina]